MGLRLRNNIWYIRKMINGKRVEVSTGYSKEFKAKAAKAAVVLIANRLDVKYGLAPKADESPASHTLTFGDYVQTYLRVYSPNKAKRTEARDDRILSWWLKIPRGRTTWGQTPITAFTPTDCEAALNYRRKAGILNTAHTNRVDRLVAEGTINRERGLVQAVFERACKDQIIERNPFAHIAKEPEEARNRILLPVDEAKMVAAFEAMPGGPNQPPSGRRWIRFMQFVLETGLRLDEILKVELSDLKYFPGKLHVHGKGRKRRAVCAICKRAGGACRNVVLSKRAQEILDFQLADDGVLWKQNPQRYREVLALGAKRAGILNTETFPHDNLSPHDLRHSFGHRWLTGQTSTGKRGDIYTLSKVLGHSSVAVTEKHYAFLSESDIEARVREIMDVDAVE